MKIVAGIERQDAGVMLWQGREVSLRAPGDAAAIGIAMVHQESLLAPHLSVAENIFLGREERLPFGWVSRRRMLEKAARLIEEHHFPLHADWRVERLSPAGKQLVEICRAIQHGSSLLIFDEPTASLSGEETQEVFRIVRTLRERKWASSTSRIAWKNFAPSATASPFCATAPRYTLARSPRIST